MKDCDVEMEVHGWGVDDGWYFTIEDEAKKLIFDCSQELGKVSSMSIPNYKGYFINPHRIKCQYIFCI